MAGRLLLVRFAFLSRFPFLLRFAGAARFGAIALAFLLAGSRASAANGSCPATQTGSIAGYTTGRLTLDGNDSVCGTRKTFPGWSSTSTVRYTTFPYYNRTGADACVTVTVTATSEEVATAAYYSSFSATNPSLDYLGDPGATASALPGSTHPSQTYSINVPGPQPGGALSTFLIMVQETAYAAGGTFTLNVTNCGAAIATGISPAFGPAAGGSVVSVGGSGFLSGAMVTLGGTPLTGVTVANDESISGTTGAHAGGAVDVVVTNSNGTHATLAGGYSYLPLAPSSVAVSTPPAPCVVGQAITLTAQLSGSNPPGGFDGTVTFEDGTTPLGSPVAVSAGGAASLTASLATAGTHAITAVYNGGTYFAPSTSPPLSEVVAQASTQTVLTSGNATWGLGEPLTFTAAVTPLAPGGGTPTGTVMFAQASAQGSLLLGSGSLEETDGGTIEATLTTSILPAGNDAIVATYSGDANYLTSYGSWAQTIQLGATGETLTSSQPGAPVYGTPIMFRASLVGVVTAPTGTVTFSFNGGGQSAETVQTLTGTSSQALVASDSIPAGTNTVVAAYSGDANNAPSSQTLTQVIARIPTTTSIVSSSENPAFLGDSVTIIAQVTGPDGGAPLGATTSVQFVDSLSNTSVPEPLTNGKAMYTFTAASGGTHTIFATYAGWLDYGGSTSADLLEVVEAVDGGADAGAGADAGEDAGAPDAGDAGPVDGGDAGSAVGNDAGPRPSSGDDAGPGSPEGPVNVSAPVPGACGCTAAGRTSSGSLAIFGFAAALAGALGRRRRS